MSIVALFDMSGYSVEPWAKAGWECFCLDIINSHKRVYFPSGGSITWLHWNAKSANAYSVVENLKPSFILSFPPCTDLAASGAAHFKAKLADDPDTWNKAMAMVYFARNVGEKTGAPWIIENPKGKISTLWRKPDYISDPRDFGGYLPEDDVHPKWPEYIEPRDAYFKGTCYWKDKRVKKPVEKTVFAKYYNNGHSKQAHKLGGRSAKTKEIRSMTPRGWAIANFLANEELARSVKDNRKDE